MFLLLRSSPLTHFGRLLECRGLTENPKHVLVISVGGSGGGGAVGGQLTYRRKNLAFPASHLHEQQVV